VRLEYHRWIALKDVGLEMRHAQSFYAGGVSGVKKLKISMEKYRCSGLDGFFPTKGIDR